MEQGEREEALRVIQRWGEMVGYPTPGRLGLVLRAMDAPELTEEALAVLEDLRRTTGLQAGFLASLYLSLDAPAGTLRIVQEAIAERHGLVPFLGPILSRRMAEDPENPERYRSIRAALLEARIPVS